MKQTVRRIVALGTAILLCLYAAAPVFAESPEDSAGEETVQPEAKATMTPEELQAAGILTVGSKGDEVTRLQQRLKELGYLEGKVDGLYGGGTKRAVIAFQRRNGLETDGIAGQETLAKLYSDEAEAAPENKGPVDVLAGNLPVLVNRDHPLDEFFTPADLVLLKDVLSSKLVKIKYKKTRGVRTAVEALGAMLEAAKADGLGKWQISAGYRSWDDQVNVLNSKVRSYRQKNKDWSSSKARRAALRSVAEPGCSEHHLGLAFDVNKQGASSFAGTKQSAWLNDHCWEYGFIIRYQKEKEAITGFTAEPWHVRYVGVKHAMYMKEHNLCLEEYLQGIDDGTIQNPAVMESGDETSGQDEEGSEGTGNGVPEEESEDAA